MNRDESFKVGEVLRYSTPGQPTRDVRISSITYRDGKIDQINTEIDDAICDCPVMNGIKWHRDRAGSPNRCTAAREEGRG